MAQQRFITYAELRPTFGIPWTRQHLDRLIAKGDFPQKHAISAHRVGWWSAQIEQWLASKGAPSQ